MGIGALWRAQLHRFGLHAHRDLGVAVRRVEADVTEPATDDIDVDTGFEKMDGGRVPPDVRRDAPRIAGAAGGLDAGGQVAHTLVDPKARQRAPGTGYEHGAVGIRSASADEQGELLGGLLPEWTCPPLAALPPQPNGGRSLEREVRNAQVRDLLDAGTGVVEEQQQNTVAKCESPEGGQAREELLNLIAPDELSVGQRSALAGDGGDLLAQVQGLGAAPAEVLEERAQCCEPLVACWDAVMPVLLHVPQEAEYLLETELLELQSADGPACTVRQERKEEPQRVAVATNRTLTQALLLTQIVDEEVVHNAADREGAHNRTSRTALLPNASKRWLAASRSSLVIVRYTAVLCRPTWPRKVERWLSRACGSMPSRYHRRSVRTANVCRSPWTQGARVPKGTLSASRGRRWSRDALRIEWVAIVDRPFQVKNGASGMGNPRRCSRSAPYERRRAARRGPNGTRRLLPNLLLRTSSTSRCRSTSPHCRRETSPMRSPRTARSAKTVA